MRVDFLSAPLWLQVLIVLAHIIIPIAAIARALAAIMAGQSKKIPQNSAPTIIVQQRKISSSVSGQKIPSWVLWITAAISLEMAYFAIDVLWLMTPRPDPDAVREGAIVFIFGAIGAAIAVVASIRHNRRLSRW